jgi:hypothetical protein
MSVIKKSTDFSMTVTDFSFLQRVMGGFGSEPQSKPKLDQSELQNWVQVWGFDPDRTIGSVRGLANSRTLANGF